MPSMHCRPCSNALRIRPMPPSSPTMYSPGTLVSKFSRMRGSSTPRLSVPKTSLIASTGQARSQRPWPMQRAGATATAWPFRMPSTVYSGHDAGMDRHGSDHAVPQRLQPGLRVLGHEAPRPTVVRKQEGEGEAQPVREDEQLLHPHHKLVQMLARSSELVSPPPVRCRESS